MTDQPVTRVTIVRYPAGYMVSMYFDDVLRDEHLCYTLKRARRLAAFWLNNPPLLVERIES